MIYKAKKGDKVRCIKDYRGGTFSYGTIYELREDFDSSDACMVVRVTRDDRGSTLNGWDQKYFEPVTVTNTPSAGETAEQIAIPNRTRTFSTGATRDTDENKLDMDGFFSPLVMRRFAEHMHSARKLPDGSMRASDNWQLGLSQEVYMKSLFRHFFSVWEIHRGWGVEDIEAELCALLFNASGMLHEILKAKRGA